MQRTGQNGGLCHGEQKANSYNSRKNSLKTSVVVNHSKIKLSKLFSLLIQFNKIAIQCNTSQASLIKYKFTLPTIEKKKDKITI